MISRSGIWALKACAILAELPVGTYVGAARLARRTGAPMNYLGKLLRVLSQRHLLASQKGFDGGFRLARPAAKISLYEIVGYLEPVERWSGCILGGKTCRDGTPCSLHRRWKAVRETYLTFLREKTIADVVSPGRSTTKAKVHRTAKRSAKSGAGLTGERQ